MLSWRSCSDIQNQLLLLVFHGMACCGMQEEDLLLSALIDGDDRFP